MSAERVPEPMFIPGPQPVEDPLAAYQRIVLFDNPKSRHSGGLGHDIQVLQTAPVGRKFDVAIYHSSPVHEQNIETINEAAEAGDLLVFRGGDGTICELQSAAKALKLTNSIYPLARGNANDEPDQLVGKHADIVQVMRAHNVIDLHSLDLEFSLDSGDTLEADAWVDASFGSSADTGRRYNTSEYRQSPWHKLPKGIGTFVLERLVAARAFLEAEPFTIKDERGEREIIERIIANGARMAKQLYIGGNLFTDEARVIEVANKVQGVRTLRRMMRARPVGEPLSHDGFAFSLRSATAVFGQIDGEDFLLPGETLVTGRRSEQAVRVFAAPLEHSVELHAA